jgi:glycosyltransferase involved in cell wall biosynthesis
MTSVDHRICLVSREVYPFTGGGIAPMVAATASLLSEVAQVKILTTHHHREHYDRLRAEDPEHPRLPPPRVEFVFVEEPGPDDLGGFFSHMHGWSARVFEALVETYPDGGPDLVEFADYLAEGFVTIQARHGLDPRVRNTTVVSRCYTPVEMVAVLNGRVTNEFATQAVWEAERYCLKHADRILHPGGDVYGTYERFYGAGNVAPPHEAKHAVFGDVEPTRTTPPGLDRLPERELRLLYLGRMERRKGVQNLLRALASLGPRDDWTLDLLGGDTDTAPLHRSMRNYLEAMAGGDEQIRFLGHVDRWQVAEVIREHDVVVIPSLWECWPNTALEALSANRPVLATPVGGLTEIVEPGRSGWLTDGAGWRSLAEGIQRLLDNKLEAAELTQSGGPVERYGELTDRQRILNGYIELLEERPGRRRAPARATDPLVSVIVPYFRLEGYVEETVRSALEQTYENVEVVVVNDGSLRPEDAVLDGLANLERVKVVTQRNAGLGAARNFGITQALGRYVLPLDADDRIAPTFLERCLEVLEQDPSAAYATTWSAYMKPDGTLFEGGAGWAPFGNWSKLIRRNNVASTCTAVLRRSLFDQGFEYSDELASYEDWFLYYELHEAGHFGVVIPERLIEYRVRPESMLREFGAPKVKTLFDELNAHLREREVQWEAS